MEENNNSNVQDNQPTPQDSQTFSEKDLPVQKKKSQAWLYILLLVLIAVVVFFVRVIFAPTPNDIIINTPELMDTPESTVTKEVISFNPQESLSSMSIEDVMYGIAAQYIPQDQIQIETGYELFEVPAFRHNLDGGSYEKLDNYFNVTQFPSSQHLNLNTPTWEAYSATEASDIFGKEGFICTLLRPNRFSIPVNFACSQVGDISKNTLEETTQFMDTLFAEAEFSCVAEGCDYETTTQEIPLPPYTKKALFFEQIVLEDSLASTEEIRTEVQDVAEVLATAGWDTQYDDYTQTERSWSKEVITSQRITATNEYMECMYTVTLGSYGRNNKRRMVECEYTINAITSKQPEINAAINL